MKYFARNKPINTRGGKWDIDDLRKKYTRIPEAYFQKLELKKYARNTAETYCGCFEKFIRHFPTMQLIEIQEEDIKTYIQRLIQVGLANSTVNQSINSIKFYYEVVLGMPDRFYDIERPLREEKLTEVISKEDVKEMINRTYNLKHQCIISLLYSGRVGRGI